MNQPDRSLAVSQILLVAAFFLLLLVVAVVIARGAELAAVDGSIHAVSEKR